MSAEAIARVLGGARSGGGWLCRCPLPTHGQGRGDKRPSLSIADGERALIVKCFGGCESRDVLTELRQRGLVEGGVSTTIPRVGGASTPPTSTIKTGDLPPTLQRRHLALAIWNEARDPRGTIAEAYLGSRGLELPDEIAGEVIRFHANCAFKGARHPCMIALFRRIIGDEPVAIHRTALTPDGQKIDRGMLGPVAGAAIKLDADAHVETGLVVGEGIESCVAGRQLGFRPTWALGSSSAVAAFPVLPGVEALTILGEHDQASARAVQACGERWSEAGREVLVVRPRTGNDVNDALRAA